MDGRRGILFVHLLHLVAGQGGADMMPFLNSVANFTAKLSLPSNHLRYPNGSTMLHNAGGTDHIFVNGNLARVLLSTWRLQQKKNPEFLRQGLEWCDTLCSLQQPIVSSQGNDAGYWGVGYPRPSNCSADEVANALELPTLLILHVLPEQYYMCCQNSSCCCSCYKKKVNFLD